MFPFLVLSFMVRKCEVLVQDMSSVDSDRSLDLVEAGTGGTLIDTD
jgi:hypothetical protein